MRLTLSRTATLLTEILAATPVAAQAIWESTV